MGGPGVKCPECQQGKPGNCTGWTLLNDDEWGECETVNEEEDVD